MDYSAIANLPNLQPGSTGPDVVKLQQWLVANGFMTQTQMNTGPGTYGPATKAAVASWQSQAGFNTQGNPGYFGPLSKSYIQQQTTAKTQTQTQTQTQAQTQTPQKGSGVPYDPSWAARGITQQMWNSMNAQQQATIGAALTAGKAIVQNTGHTVTMSDALAAAAKDPILMAKYSDALGIDKMQLQQTMQQAQTAASTTAQQQQMQFEQERKALAEQAASAGQAYSGFRGKAQENLAKTESGIVTSSRAALQKQVDDATAGFVSKYGTQAPGAATALTYQNPLAASGVSMSGLLQKPAGTTDVLQGTLPQGITGSEVLSKQADITNLAGQTYSLGATPSVKPA